ncbi:MAG TPA: hypothetical protein VFV41_27410 [Streptosporangiaceae bacterium]|nr:hypothetical protein [Streptosporangiaceae bacterium]
MRLLPTTQPAMADEVDAGEVDEAGEAVPPAAASAPAADPMTAITPAATTIVRLAVVDLKLTCILSSLFGMFVTLTYEMCGGITSIAGFFLACPARSPTPPDHPGPRRRAAGKLRSAHGLQVLAAIDAENARVTEARMVR